MIMATRYGMRRWKYLTLPFPINERRGYSILIRVQIAACGREILTGKSISLKRD